MTNTIEVSKLEYLAREVVEFDDGWFVVEVEPATVTLRRKIGSITQQIKLSHDASTGYAICVCALAYLFNGAQELTLPVSIRGNAMRRALTFLNNRIDALEGIES